MYETLIMLKPGASFSPDEMQAVVAAVAANGAAGVERRGASTRLKTAAGYVEISPCGLPHVVEESREIAETLGIPCRECAFRFEMEGEEPDMELFNDYLIINERLHATGKFVIFDANEGKLMFED